MMPRKQTILTVTVAICAVALAAAGTHHYQNSKKQEAERKRIMAESVEWALHLGNANLARHKEGALTLNVEAKTDFPYYGTSFDDEKGNSLRILSGGGSGWGIGSSPIGGQRDFQPLPSSFELTYYSWFTNSYYRLERQPLPKAELYKLMTTPVMAAGGKPEPINLTYLTLNVAPEGWVTLFAGGPGILKELYSWQAKEIVPDPAKLDKEKSSGIYRMLEFQKKYRATFEAEDRQKFPEFYRKYMSGGIHQLSADWYKKMQTKYPWVLQVELADAGNWQWNGEYAVQFANAEFWDVVGKESVAADRLIQKAVPYYFKFWLEEQKTGERWAIVVRLFQDDTWKQNWRYHIYYDDPYLNALYRQFQSVFPKRTRQDNNRPVSPADFAVLKLKLDAKGDLAEAVLEKNGKSVKLGVRAHVVQRYEVKQGEYW